MTNLSKTLRHLLAFYGHAKCDIDQAEQDIMMAFVKAGWVQPIMLNRQQAFDATKNVIYQTPTLMTKEEWEARAVDTGWKAPVEK